jgi:uncharacterized protein DUF4166
MYKFLLGPVFHQLPDSIQTLHRSPGTFGFHGACDVRRGESLVSRLLARAASLPPAGTGPLSVTVESNGENEVWTRQFGSHQMQSFLRARTNLLNESLGLARFIFRLTLDQRRIRWTLVEVRAVGFRIPRQWFDFDVSEYDQDGRYHFNVKVSVRGGGLLVHYSGWLA